MVNIIIGAMFILFFYFNLCFLFSILMVPFVCVACMPCVLLLSGFYPGVCFGKGDMFCEFKQLLCLTRTVYFNFFNNSFLLDNCFLLTLFL